ncbi:MAG: glycosyltransferase [Patescibacteria group bacterium]
MIKRNFCAIIPAFNEEKVISSSLCSLKKIFGAKDIYVVSDGSTDKTVSLAKCAGVNVLGLRKNGGKALAQEKVIKKFKLTKRYKYVLFSDADSQLDPEFLNAAKVYFPKLPALIVGTVKSEKKGLISAFRAYEYGLSHRIFKNAQNLISVITVAPGCASFYNSSVLEKLCLKSPTLTEDFDLTIQIHQKNLGKIIYASKAIVITQDPSSFRDYWKQVLRWNIGTWQNYFLYKLYKPNSKYNVELNFLFLDNFLWVASIIIALSFPATLINILIGMILTIYSSALIVSFLEKKCWIILYIPVFPIFLFINIASYFYAIFKVVSSPRRRTKLTWNKVARY